VVVKALRVQREVGGALGTVRGADANELLSGDSAPGAGSSARVVLEIR